MNGLHHQVAKIQGLDHLSLQKNPVSFDPKMESPTCNENKNIIFRIWVKK